MGVFENGFILVCGLVLLGVAAIYLGLRQGTTWMLALGALLAAAGGGVWLADHFVDTPTEQVNHRLDELASASERSDVEFLVDSLSPSIVAENYTHARLSQLIRREVPRIGFRSVRLNGREFRMDGDRVVAQFLAMLGGGDGEIPMRFEMTFANEGGAWQITRIRRLDLLNPDQEVPVGAY